MIFFFNLILLVSFNIFELITYACAEKIPLFYKVIETNQFNNNFIKNSLISLLFKMNLILKLFSLKNNN